MIGIRFRSSVGIHWTNRVSAGRPPIDAAIGWEHPVDDEGALRGDTWDIAGVLSAD